MPNFTAKQVLAVDGLTCTILFLAGVFATALVADLLGLPENIVAIAGWIGLPCAAVMFFLASQKAPSTMLINLVALGNVLWVAASFAVVVVFVQQMTWLGIAAVILQALVVLDFAIFEARGAKALAQQPMAASLS